MTNIKPGDQARLKSGGPMMTISVVEDDEAVCVWFEGKSQKVFRFNLVVLINKEDIEIARAPIVGPRRSHSY